VSLDFISGIAIGVLLTITTQGFFELLKLLHFPKKKPSRRKV